MSNNASSAVRRLHSTFFGRYHTHTSPPQELRMLSHVRSITRTITSITGSEYKNFSHSLLTIEPIQRHSSSNDELRQPPLQKQLPKDQLVFGKQFTPHMLQIQYSHQQWSEPKIVPYQNLAISPAASCLHYGTYAHVIADPQLEGLPH